jgi:actin-like ATPase involved in cell morphogenesis
MTKLEEDAALFLENAEGLSGLPKRDVQKEMFRLKREMEARYDFEVEGFEEDYEARLSTGEESDDHGEFVVDLRGGETEVNAFVVIDGEVVVNEVRDY